MSFWFVLVDDVDDGDAIDKLLRRRGRGRTSFFHLAFFRRIFRSTILPIPTGTRHGTSIHQPTASSTRIVATTIVNQKTVDVWGFQFPRAKANEEDEKLVELYGQWQRQLLIDNSSMFESVILMRRSSMVGSREPVSRLVAQPQCQPRSRALSLMNKA